MPRKPTCECGECPKCLHRAKVRDAYQNMSVDERRALVARRNPETVRKNDRERYERDKDKRLAAAKAYADTPAGREARQRAYAKWLENNREKRRAHQKLNNAIRDGKLARGTACELAGDDCKGRLEAHHDDYSKPLEVRWLCTRHHRQHHRRQMADQTPSVTDMVTGVRPVHPATEKLLRYFDFEHLPKPLAAISEPFHDLAYDLAANPDLEGPELTVGLRKLLEAKDCVVRAALPLK